MKKTISLVGQKTHSFATVEETVSFLRQHLDEMFIVYASSGDFYAIKRQAVDAPNSEARVGISNYHSRKGEATTGDALEDLNDMIDSSWERIQKREGQITYGGESRK